jgi:excisionase family DNA binding protein
MLAPDVSLIEEVSQLHVFSDDYPSTETFDINAAAVSPDTPKLLYTRKEASYSLGISLRSIGYLLKAGKLKYRKVGTKTLIPHESLVKFSKGDHSLTQSTEAA